MFYLHFDFLLLLEESTIYFQCGSRSIRGNNSLSQITCNLNEIKVMQDVSRNYHSLQIFIDYLGVNSLRIRTGTRSNPFGTAADVDR